MPHPLRAIVIDFDGYFAGVEQHLNPALRGKPIGVVPMMTESTCCIASSYEAKAFGVKTGTRVREARQMCPGLQIVEAKHEKYVRCHHLALEAIESCLPVGRVMSIDEAACVLPKNFRRREEALEMAFRIKEAMKKALSQWITCSVGIAPNDWLAKVASQVDKPDGITVWEDGRDLTEGLFRMKLGDLHGVGPRMESRIRSYGISSVRQLYALDRERLRQVWGSVEGARLWSHLHGELIPAIQSPRRSVGHSHVMSPAERAPRASLAVLQGLTLKAGRRLRSYGMMAGRMGLHLKLTNGRHWEKGCRFQETQDSFFFSRLLNELWEERPTHQVPVLRGGVILGDLVEMENATLSLFASDHSRQISLNKALDQIAARFGNGAVSIGGAHGSQNATPPKVAFQHVPDLDIEL